MLYHAKTIITAAGPNMMPLLSKYSLPTFVEYANTFDYDLRVIPLEKDSMDRKADLAKSARWHKISIMRDALTNSKVVIWLDADIMICRNDEDIISNLEPHDYQGFVLHDVPAENRINPNSGVWVMRQEQRSLDFLNTIETIGLPGGRWADQGAIMRALGWNLGDENYFGAKFPQHGSCFLEGTQWLPIGWNQPSFEDRQNLESYEGRPRVPNPHAVHFMAMTIEQRMASMAKLAADLRSRN